MEKRDIKLLHDLLVESADQLVNGDFDLADAEAIAIRILGKERVNQIIQDHNNNQLKLEL